MGGGPVYEGTPEGAVEEGVRGLYQRGNRPYLL